MAKNTKKTPTPIVEEVKEPISELILDKEEPLNQKVINTYLLNVREAPSTKAKIKNEIKEGERVRVFEEVGDWTKIGDNEWVMTKYLK